MSSVVSMSVGVTRRKRRSEQQWQELVDRYESSAQAQIEFCRGQGISVASLCKWRQRLRGDAHGARQASVAAEFVRFDPSADAVAATGITIRLDLGAGVVLEIHRH